MGIQVAYVFSPVIVQCSPCHLTGKIFSMLLGAYLVTPLQAWPVCAFPPSHTSAASGNPQPRTLHGALSTKSQSKADLDLPHSAHLQSVFREPLTVWAIVPLGGHAASQPGRNFAEHLTHPTTCPRSTMPLLCSEKWTFNLFLKISRERNSIISLSKLFLLLINIRMLE